MNFDPTYLLVSFAFGTLGLALFTWARSQARLLHVVGGLTLMIAPWFCATTAVMVGVCGALVVVLGLLLYTGR
ncbi:MAG: hypothetical protein ACOYOB_13560 [Myxococcota bacterium]